MNLLQNSISALLASGMIAAVSINPLASAELYKWVDENGVTQYSQSPPLDKSGVQTLNVKVTPADQSALEKMKSRVETADKLRDTRLEDEKLNRQVEEAKAVTEENCRRSKARVAAYSIPNALIEREDGSRERVDEPTRQKELAASREMVKQYCG